MLKLPNAVGLVLCEQVIVEEKTRNVTLVNTFDRLRFDSFPTPPRRFFVYVMLTDGLGDAQMSVVISRLDTLEEIDERHWSMRSSDPLRNFRFAVRFGSIVFPVPGPYEVCLFANREWVAQTVFT